MIETPVNYTNGTPLVEATGYVTELEERLAALEFALETLDWRLLTAQADQEFSRQGMRNIVDLARVMYLKNPLVKRGVKIMCFYVWGQGWTIRAKNEEIQAVIDAFLYDQKNDDIIGSHEARTQLEVELETDGNLFFCFFINKVTGRIRLRTINFNEIEDVIRNPDDAKEPWYYKRAWTEERFNVQNGSIETTQMTAYYPDWRYTPTSQPQTINGNPVHWDKPIYHVRIGGFSNWKFGLSEIYAEIDWSKAYKDFLEDWASIVRAYRKFAFQLTTPGGSRTVAAAKTKLATTLTGTASETNPPPTTGSIFVASEGHKLDPVRTSGATVSAEDGRRMLLMVAASRGLPETFYGDGDVGNHATAKTLDRPTELMMEDRQALWRDVFLNIVTFVEMWQIKATGGKLKTLGTVVNEVEDGQNNEHIEWNEDVNDDVSIDFPPILQHDIPQMVTATVQAATLGQAGTLAGTIDLPNLSRVLFTMIGIPDVDEMMEQLFPGGEVPEPEEEDEDEELPERPQAEAMMVEAVKELRNALIALRG